MTDSPLQIIQFLPQNGIGGIMTQGSTQRDALHQSGRLGTSKDSPDATGYTYSESDDLTHCWVKKRDIHVVTLLLYSVEIS